MNDQSTKNLPASSQSIYRRATLDDVVFIARLLREFYSKIGGIYKIPFDFESTLVTVDAVVQSGICIVGPTSCAGAIRRLFPYNFKAQAASIEFWYFRKKREIGIFEELIKLCKATGVTHTTCTSHFPANTIGRFYRKCGFISTETLYSAELNKID